jgi:hypothetical protein
MNAMSRMSPPLVGHASGNSSPNRAMSFAQAIRDASCEGLAPAAQQSVPVPLALYVHDALHDGAGLGVVLRVLFYAWHIGLARSMALRQRSSG